MKAKGKGLWKGLSCISFLVSAAALSLGLDKMLYYDNGEYYPYEYHNVYVGGDAYNYIINGNYATGFFVLAAMFALMGIGFIVLYYLSKMADGQGKLLSRYQARGRNWGASEEMPQNAAAFAAEEGERATKQLEYDWCQSAG